MGFLHGKSVLVTGGAGFLGRQVCASLQAFGPNTIRAPRSADYDLRQRAQICAMLDNLQPDVVIHLAAVVGGIGANRDNPGRYFYENAIMGIELIEQCRIAEVEKTVVIGSICAYPKHTPTPFRECNLWNGYPEETNAPYGLAKKMLLVQAQAYRQQYGMNAITLLPVNLYGPGDNFDTGSSHVIPALIRKVVEAQQVGAQTIPVWGTGSASREFLFVRDAARGIAMATESYNGSEPVNLGSGHEITIRELAELICELAGYDGALVWDSSKPDGQPRRRLDTSRAAESFGFLAATDFRAGLQETIDWYRQSKTSKHTRAA
jgi:GDP-L-fucose synthase